MNQGPAQNITPNPVEEIDNSISQKKGSGKKMLFLLLGLFVIIFIALIAAFLFLKSQGADEQEPVELTYWITWEDPNVLQPIIDEFEEINPNITVNLEVQDAQSNANYIEKIKTRSANGTGPDIFRFHNSWIPQLKSYLFPLPQELLETIEFSDTYFTGVQKAVSYKGAVYGLPLGIDTLSLFVNKELFSGAGYTTYPRTWDEVVSVGRELTVKDETGKILTAGVAMGTYDNVQHASDIISLLFIQNGAELDDLNGERAERAKVVLDNYTSYARGRNSIWDSTQENSKLAFAKGKLAMYFGYSWDILGIQAVNPLLEYEIIPVPHIPQTDQTVISFWAEGISSSSTHPREAFMLLSFLSQNENLEKIFANQSKVRLVGGIYPKKTMEGLLSDGSRLSAFITQAETAEPTIFSSDTHDGGMVDLLNEHLADAIRAIHDNTSAQSALEDLALGVTEVINRYDPPPVPQE